MSVPLLLLLLAPLGGAVLSLTFGVAPVQRRLLVALACAATLGGGIAAVVRTATSDAVAWRGFSLNAWTALLALGAITTVIAGIARAGGSPEPGRVEAGAFIAGAAGLVPIAVTSVHLLAVALPVSTLAFAASVLLTPGSRMLSMQARRATATLALSDVLILVSLGTSVSEGTTLPPKLSLLAGFLLLAGIAVRLGAVPFPWGPGEAMRASPAAGAIWLGPVRAQALALMPFAIASGPTVAYAAAAAAAASAAWHAWRATRGSGVEALSGAGLSYAVLGFAAGGPAGMWGAVLVIASVFLILPAWAARRAARETIRPSAGVLSAGALLPGGALVVASLFDVAAVRPGFYLVAVPAIGAALGLAVATLGTEDAGSPRRSRRDVAIASVLGWGAVVAALTLASVPQRVTHALAFPATDVLGVGRLLRTAPEPGMADGLAMIVMAAAALSFLVGPGRLGSGGPPRRTGGRTEPALPLPRAIHAIPHLERAWTIAGTVMIAASIGIALRVYDVAAGRGFL